MKRYSNYAFIYAILALVFGVFYREYTRFNDFSGFTSLSVIHTHYFMLGMFFFLVILLLEKNFHFTNKLVNRLNITYQIGLNITIVGLLLRGLAQVNGNELSKAMDAAISGVSGLGHIVLGVSLIMILFQIKKAITE